LAKIRWERGETPVRSSRSALHTATPHFHGKAETLGLLLAFGRVPCLGTLLLPGFANCRDLVAIALLRIRPQLPIPLQIPPLFLFTELSLERGQGSRVFLMVGAAAIDPEEAPLLPVLTY
jgi:hypothetical protein